ncbi:MAG: ECF-type sigma factor [Pseudomonadota bacterium]
MSEPDITAMLEQARQGDADAAQRVYAAVYEELKRIALAQRGRWQGNDTLNPTALLNEAFIRLSGQDAAFSNRTHFYATASRAMRHVLVNYAEQRNAAKRGGKAPHLPLEELSLIDDASAEELLTLHTLLEALEMEEPRRARVVECRVFGGMSVSQTAQALSISPATVKREWQLASVALYRALD